jgi:hypothetical protein
LNGIQLSKHGDIIIKSNACFDDIESDALYLAKLLDNLANSWAHNRYFLFEFYKGTKKLWASLDKKRRSGVLTMWCQWLVGFSWFSPMTPRFIEDSYIHIHMFAI